MYSDKVLLCAPYRFQFTFFYKNDKFIKNELFNVKLTGINARTKTLVKYGLATNFDIVDSESLATVVDQLQKGEFRLVKDVEKVIYELDNHPLKPIFIQLLSLTENKGIQAFDDCRIIDVITKAYSASLISDEQFHLLFDSHTNRIINDYTSWEQYLASCVLGKLCQHEINSNTVTDAHEFINDIYNYCLMTINVFAYANYWKNSNIEILAELLAKLLESNFNEAKNDVETIIHDTRSYAHVENLSVDFLEKWVDDYMNIDDIDLNKYDYLTNLAAFVLWNPLVENQLDWMFSIKNNEQSSLFMPKEFAGLVSAYEFWLNYKKLSEMQNSNIFAMFCKIKLSALFTEKQLYLFENKLFKKVTIAKAWNEVKFDVEFDFDFGVVIKVDGKIILEMLEAPDYSLIGLTKQHLKAMDSDSLKQLENQYALKLQNVLNDIPNKIKVFK